VTVEALSDSGNDRIVDGGNAPPAFDAHKANIDDLRTEATVWLDGQAVTTAEEAEGLTTLIDLARIARDAADAQRVAEKKPHDDASKAVQAKWKPLVDGAQRILDVCLEKVAAWRVAERDRKEAAAALARAEAEAEAEAATAALQGSAGDLVAREQAEQVVESAKMAGKVASKAEKAATKGNGLRTFYRAQITDFAAAARHYWQPEHDRFEALVLEFAQRDVTAGRRDIPGVTAIPEHKAI
jgi:hypothetical protein